MYLAWYDDSTKKSTEQKIAEAIAAYTDKFRSAPNVVLVSEEDKDVAVPGVLIRSEGYIRKSNFWIGWEDSVRGIT
jgi:hypothetical protein